MKVICDYCGDNAKLVTGKEVYQVCSRRLKALYFWKCQPCDAWVGCHPVGYKETGRRLLGRLANKELREMRKMAHVAFDKLWIGKQCASTQRQASYAWLSLKMGLKREQAHIGMFNVDECKKVVDLVNERLAA